MKKIILLIIALLIFSSFIYAGPFRDVEIYVVNPYGEPVQDALVEMSYQYNNHYNYSGITDENGYLLLEVDARIWELVKLGYENLTKGVNPNGNVPVKDSVKVDVKDINDPLIDIPKENVGSVNAITGNVAKNGYPLYPVMTFNYDLTPQGVYDFIPVSEQRSFSLRNNVVLEFEVDNGAPIINLPEDLETNELSNHRIIITLPAYITDIDNDFDDLVITFPEQDWSGLPGSIEKSYNHLIVDFFPELNINYHQDNSVTFTIGVNDSIHYVEKEYTYYYYPELKALSGNVTDLYNNTIVNNINIQLLNGYNNLNIIENNEFITFFNTDESPKINISTNNYYDSVRYIQSNEEDDINYEFIIIPITYDPDFGGIFNGDYLQSGLTRVFRSYPTGLTKRWNEPAIFCVDTNNTMGYYPTLDDLTKVNNTLNYIYNYTNSFMNPFDGSHYIATDNGTCNPYLNGQIGYLTVNWDNGIPGSGSHGETYHQNGYTIIGATILINPPTPQSTCNQEIFQGLGGTKDIDDTFFNLWDVTYWPPGISTFCDSSDCAIGSIPQYFDIDWGRFAYSRAGGNAHPDTDYEILYGKLEGKFTEVITFFTVKGKEYYIKKGYAPANQHIDSWDEVLTKLPNKAELIIYDYPGIEVKTKKHQLNNIKNNEIKNKINKLLKKI